MSPKIREQSETPERLFFTKVQQLMGRKLMKQVHLAPLIGVAPSRISLWFRGTGWPNAYQFRSIAQALILPGEDLNGMMKYLTDDSLTTLPDLRNSGFGPLNTEQRLLLDLAPYFPGGVDGMISRLKVQSVGEAVSSTRGAVHVVISITNPTDVDVVVTVNNATNS